MNDRKTKWTWGDFRPIEKSRSEIELDLLSCLLHCPVALDQIAHLKTQVRFEKKLHSKIFQALQELYQTDNSICYLKLMELLLEDTDADRRSVVKNFSELLTAWTQPPNVERAVELSNELIEMT